jgi:transcriptional regulator with XRE-family HTH domain
MKLNKNIIAENIKNLRDELSLSLEEVGKRIGVSKQTILRYETGEIKNIPYDKIVALARVFEVSPSYLMGFEDARIGFYESDLLREEREIIKKLRKIDPEYKPMIMSLIDTCYANTEAKRRKKTENSAS